MVKRILVATLFVFAFSSLSVNNAPADPKVLVSKEKAAIQETQTAPTGKASDIRNRIEAAGRDVEKKQEQAPAAKPPAASEPEKPVAVEKERQGIVTGKSPQGLAIEYAVDKKEGGQEVWLNYGEGVQASDFSEIEEGDTVNAVYDETEGARQRSVKKIALIHKKPKEPATFEEAGD